MWPFARRPAVVDLAAVEGPTLVDVIAKVRSPNDVTSPVTEARAAAIVVDVVVESELETREVGSVALGDRLELEAGASSVVVVVRHARFRFLAGSEIATPLTVAVPELVGLMRLAPGGGAMGYREHVVSRGDAFRLRAVVERVPSVVAAGYRSFAGSTPVARLVARDDLGPVLLEEVFAGDEPPLRR